MIRRLVAIRTRKEIPSESLHRFEADLLETPRHVKDVLDCRATPNLSDSPDWNYCWELTLRSPLSPLPHEIPTVARYLLPGPGQVVERALSITFEPFAGSMAEPGIKNCLKRTLVIELRPGTSPTLAKEMERRLMGMPRYIRGIRNWAISRAPQASEYPRSSVAAAPNWSIVWEQEFQDERGHDEYMQSAFHWGYVDLLFDRDSPYNIAGRNVHVFYRSHSTVLGWKG